MRNLKLVDFKILLAKIRAAPEEEKPAAAVVLVARASKMPCASRMMTVRRSAARGKALRVADKVIKEEAPVHVSSLAEAAACKEEDLSREEVARADHRVAVDCSRACMKQLTMLTLVSCNRKEAKADHQEAVVVAEVREALLAVARVVKEAAVVLLKEDKVAAAEA